MYKRENQILEQYPLEITDTRKGRGIIYCISDQDTYLLKEYRGSELRAAFLKEVIAYLQQAGILVDNIIPNTEGLCITLDRDGIRHIVTEYTEGRECDTRNREEILSAVQALARLHKVLKEYPGEIPTVFAENSKREQDQISKHNREMKKVYKYIFSRKEKNEFEQAFLKSYPEFYRQAMEVEEQAKNLGQNGQKDEETLHLCHGDYNQHNVLFQKKNVILTNFEQMCYGEQMTDLGFFMRKMLEKHNWNTGLGMDIVSTYDRVKKITPLEMQKLYIAIAYPEKFWKIANHYQNTSKSWVCGRNMEKLEKIQRQEESRQQFLQLMCYFAKVK